MKADKRFLGQPLDFWANIKLISQKGGYTDRKTKQIKAHTLEEIKSAYESNQLDHSRVINANNNFTEFGKLIHSYLQHRSDSLRLHIEPNLMKLAEALTFR